MSVQSAIPSTELLPAIDPVVATAVGVGAVVVLWIVWRVVARIRRPVGARFRAALERVEAVSVVMHPNPDPDAMSCAVAVASLADQVGTDATLQYPGRIQHQENRAFETVLDLDVERIETIEDLAAETVVLVDHGAARGFPGAESITPYAVVDHHPDENGSERAEFVDVRPDYGACATIVAEYSEEVDAAVVPPDDQESPEGLSLSSDVATGLMYGIHSDTDYLTKGTSPAEFEACEYLYPGIDEEKLDRIGNPQVEPEVLDVKARAISNRTVKNPYAVADVGRVTNVDAIPQSADELIRLEGVTAVVVYGEKDGTIHLSGRSRDDRVHMGNCLRSLVEEIPMARGGGHARMGGGQIQREEIEVRGSQKKKYQLERRLFAAMRGEL